MKRQQSNKLRWLQSAFSMLKERVKARAQMMEDSKRHVKVVGSVVGRQKRDMEECLCIECFCRYG